MERSEIDSYHKSYALVALCAEIRYKRPALRNQPLVVREIAGKKLQHMSGDSERVEKYITAGHKMVSKEK